MRIREHARRSASRADDPLGLRRRRRPRRGRRAARSVSTERPKLRAQARHFAEVSTPPTAPRFFAATTPGSTGCAPGIALFGVAPRFGKPLDLPPGHDDPHRGRRGPRAPRRATPSDTGGHGGASGRARSPPSPWAMPTASRAISPTAGEVLIRGKRAPVVGTVSMDLDDDRRHRSRCSDGARRGGRAGAQQGQGKTPSPPPKWPSTPGPSLGTCSPAFRGGFRAFIASPEAE